MYHVLTLLALLLLTACSTVVDTSKAPELFDETSRQILSAPTSAQLTHWQHFYRASQLRSSGRIESARALLKEIPPTAASFPDALLTLALEAPWEQPEPAALRSESLFERWLLEIQRRDLLPSLVSLFARRAEHAGDIHSALVRYLRLRTLYPNHPLSSSARAFCERHAQRIQESSELRSLQRSALLAESDMSGLRLALEGELGRADPTSSVYYELLHELAKAEAASGNGEKARRILHDLSQASEESAAFQARLTLAKRAWNANEIPEAISLLRSVAPESQETTSQFSEARYLEGRIYEESHQLDKALASYKQIPLNSQWKAKAVRQQAWIEYRKKQLAQTIKEFWSIIDEFDSSASRDILDEALFWLHTLCREAPKACSSDIKRKLKSLYPSADSEYGILLRTSSRLENLRNATQQSVCQVPEISPELQARLSYLHQFNLESIGRHEIHWYIHLLSKGERRNLKLETLRVTALSFLGAHTSSLRYALQALSSVESAEHSGVSDSACSKELLRYAYPRPYKLYFESAARTHQVPVSLLFAVARTESHFDPQARSAKDAQGLLQLLVSTAREEGLPDHGSLYDPETNIHLGAKHLARLLAHYSSPYYAVAAYNAGAKAVDRWRKRFPDLNDLQWSEHIGFQETKNYVRKVLAAQLLYELLYESGT